MKTNKKYLIEWEGKKLSKSQYYIFGMNDGKIRNETYTT